MAKSLLKKRFRGSKLGRSFKRTRGHIGGTSRGDYPRYGKQSTRTVTMYNPVPARLHNIVAPRFFTDLEYGYSGFINVAASTTFWNIIGNGLHFPGNSAAPFTGAGGTLVPATHALNALNPVGLTALSGLYSNYRVWKSQLTCTLLPASAAASIGGKHLVVLPTVSEAALADTQIGQSLPYAKSIVCSASNNVRQNTVFHVMDTKTIFGISQAQMQADSNEASAVGANPAATWDWQIIVQDLLGQNLSGAASNEVSVMIRVNYHVEFFNPAANEADT